MKTPSNSIRFEITRASKWATLRCLTWFSRMRDRLQQSTGWQQAGGVALATVLGVALLITAANAADGEKSQETKQSQGDQAADTSMTLKGGQEGTVFGTLTVEGEDRIQIEFERPELDLDLDPYSAPGLDWETNHEVVDRALLDFVTPMLEQSSVRETPRGARPWLEHFSTDAVAKFQPALEGVDKWQLIVANSRGESVATFGGKGKPPEEIAWDGRDAKGVPVPPGLTYSYVLEAYDRAGNKRNFVGDGFELPPYRLMTKKSLSLLFAGSELPASFFTAYGGSLPPPILLEVATWLNQVEGGENPIRVEATAKTYEQAKTLSEAIAMALKPYVLTDPARVQALAKVENTAPERGTVMVMVER